VVAQAREQLSHATLRSRITGSHATVTEVGNLVQPNGEILRIGDLVQVDVEVSELHSKYSGWAVGRRHLDAHPNQILEGKSVAFPQLNQQPRLVPVEVVIPIATKLVDCWHG